MIGRWKAILETSTYAAKVEECETRLASIDKHIEEAQREAKILRGYVMWLKKKILKETSK